jgi:hypothetical protein
MSDFQSFGFGQNDAAIATRAKKFKGEKGVTYRIGFALWPGMEEGTDFTVDKMSPADGAPDESLTPKFIAAPRHYVETGNGSFYCLDKGPEYSKIIGKQAKTGVATVIVVWPLEQGKPTKSSLFGQKPQVLPWIISLDKYERFKKMHLSGYPMWDWDISAECTESGFQKFDFLPAKDNILKTMLKASNPEGQALAQFVIERARSLSPNLGKELGLDLSLDQLRERMGLEVSSPTGEVGGAVGEVEDLIGSMLDD